MNDLRQSHGGIASRLSGGRAPVAYFRASDHHHRAIGIRPIQYGLQGQPVLEEPLCTIATQDGCNTRSFWPARSLCDDHRLVKRQHITQTPAHVIRWHRQPDLPVRCLPSQSDARGHFSGFALDPRLLPQYEHCRQILRDTEC